MTSVHLEILVEPFRENEPGPHVQAVLSALDNAGVETDMGPFATTALTDVETIAGAMADVIRSGVGAGATALQFRLEVRDE